MSIQAELSELKGLKLELTNLNKRAKLIRKRVKLLESIIAQYIDEKDLPGIKHNGVAVILERKTRRAGKSNKMRDSDAMKVLEDYGISNPEKALRKIMEARKGDELQIDKLTLNNLNKK